MGEKVKHTQITKEKGFLYFIDSHGDISKVAMVRGSSANNKSEKIKVKKVGIKRISGFLYYLDGEGDISRVPMVRGKK